VSLVDYKYTKATVRMSKLIDRLLIFSSSESLRRQSKGETTASLVCSNSKSMYSHSILMEYPCDHDDHLVPSLKPDG
jgi:hypothetical protein